MSFDLESEASLGSIGVRGPSLSTRPNARFTLASARPQAAARQPIDDIVMEGEAYDEVPELAHSVSSRASTTRSKRVSIVDGHPELPPGYRYRPTHGYRNGSVRASSAVSAGNDERSRLSYYPAPFASAGGDVSPFDSASVVGSQEKRFNAEFVSRQHDRHANKTGAELSARLAATTDRLPPQSRRRLSSSSVRADNAVPEQLIYGRVSRVGFETVPEPGQPAPSVCVRSQVVHPLEYTPRDVYGSEVSVRTVRDDTARTRPAGSVVGSVRSVATASSRIVIDKSVLNDMTSAVVLDDINLRVLEGKNVIILKEGASFEVVGDDGEPVEPIHLDTPEQRRALGFPPVTPRDLHDRLKRSSGGKLSLVKQGGDYRITSSKSVVTGKTRRAVELHDSPRWKRMFTPI